MMLKKSKYHIEVTALDKDDKPQNVWVDCYTIQDSLNQKPRPAHAFKKLWALGQRSGGKSYEQDLKECIWTLQNELELLHES
jgi:hypothetical protein